MTRPAQVLPSVPGTFPPYTLRLPEGNALPLVCDSPHSGTMYPEDFGYSLPFETLRAGEDTDVHVLWEALPSAGATLLAAEFPRAYVDPNRDVEDIDPQMLDGAWPTPLSPSEKTRLGIGLIWREAGPDGKPIYDRLLGVAEVQQRIARYHAPYHAAMREHIEAAYARFGAVWHLNLHSMPADSYAALQLESDHPLADFVLGDRDGTTCEPELVELVERELRGRGYTVARNDPYKGVQLIARIGQPQRRRHSLQIEIRRPLYMNEATRERNDGFARVQRDLTALLHTLAAHVKDRAAAGSA